MKKKKLRKIAKRSSSSKKKHPRLSHTAKKAISEQGSPSLQTLGSTLQQKRVHLGLTQKKLAELCNLQIATIAKIENGNDGVKLGTLQTYLTALNLALSVIEAEEP